MACVGVTHYARIGRQRRSATDGSGGGIGGSREDVGGGLAFHGTQQKTIMIDATDPALLRLRALRRCAAKSTRRGRKHWSKRYTHQRAMIFCGCSVMLIPAVNAPSACLQHPACHAWQAYRRWSRTRRSCRQFQPLPHRGGTSAPPCPAPERRRCPRYARG